MSSKTAAIIGATGLTGQHLKQLLLEDNYFDIVRLIVRRPLPKTNPRIEVKLVDFNDSESVQLALEDVHTIFCCIGTTQKKVKGDKALYRKIDFDIPVNAARLGKENGCEQFIQMSSVGANNSSGNFYLKLKGEVEEALKASGINSIHIMRPSILLGKRQEFRLGERIGQTVATILSFLVPSKYKPIQSKSVAKAMLNAAKIEKPGFFVYEYKELMRIALSS
jgi:uncharacterized protein YbjT (DUF2867 family)